MEQYFNIYVMLDEEHNTRMFRKNIGEVDVKNSSTYEMQFKDAVIIFNKYKSEHQSDSLVMLVEKEIPIEGTVYNFVPRRNYVEVDENIY